MRRWVMGCPRKTLVPCNECITSMLPNQCTTFPALEMLFLTFYVPFSSPSWSITGSALNHQRAKTKQATIRGKEQSNRFLVIFLHWLHEILGQLDMLLNTRLQNDNTFYYNQINCHGKVCKLTSISELEWNKARIRMKIKEKGNKRLGTIERVSESVESKNLSAGGLPLVLCLNKFLWHCLHLVYTISCVLLKK